MNQSTKRSFLEECNIRNDSLFYEINLNDQGFIAANEFTNWFGLCSVMWLPLSSGEFIQLAAEGRDLRMTETNPPKSAKKPRWTSLEIGLITIVSLLFIIIVALIILFATQKTGE